MANPRQTLITIDGTKVAGTNSNLPIVSTRGMFAANADELFDPSSANRSAGNDLRIFDHLGNEVPREIVDFALDATTGADDGSLVAWHKHTLIDAADPATWEYTVEYGDRTLADYAVTDTFGRNAVWADYYAVWHLHDTVDATGGGLDLTLRNAPTTEAALWGLGYRLNGSNQALDFGQPPAGMTDQPLTVSGLVKSDDVTLAAQGVCIITDLSDANHHFWVRLSGGNIDASTKSTGPFDSATSTTALTNGEWGHVVGRFMSASTENSAFLNGGGKHTSSGGQDPVSSKLDGGSLGDRRPTGNAPFDGIIAEMRVHSAELSDDWILTESNNWLSPATFATAGVPENVGGATTISVTAAAAAANEQSVAVVRARVIAADAAAMAMAAQTAAVVRARVIGIVAGALAVTGQTAAVVRARVIGVISAASGLVAQSVNVVTGLRLGVTAAAMALAGQAAAVVRGRFVGVTAAAKQAVGRLIIIDQGGAAAPARKLLAKVLKAVLRPVMRDVMIDYEA